jgi:hypothetical protein
MRYVSHTVDKASSNKLEKKKSDKPAAAFFPASGAAIS